MQGHVNVYLVVNMVSLIIKLYDLSRPVLLIIHYSLYIIPLRKLIVKFQVAAKI